MLRERLPPAVTAVLSLVVYHGEASWRAPLSFAEYSSPVPALRPYLLDFHYGLVDLEPIPDAALSHSDALLALKYGSRDGVDRELLLALGRAALGLSLNDFIVAMRYILRDFDAVTEPLVREILAELTPKQEEPLMSIMLEEYKAKWLSQGEVQGEAKMLLKLLSRRFGPLPDAVHARVMDATPEQLNR